MSRLLAPAVFGALGVGILLWLGFWQVDRLAWKEDILADIDARIFQDPVSVPDTPNQEDHAYLAVVAQGTLMGPEIHVLASAKGIGARYRVIRALELSDGRRLLVDQGFLPLDLKDAPRPDQNLQVRGNLHWPDEINSATPEVDTTRQIWFARDVPAMAAALNTEPTLIVAQATTPEDTQIRPFPVDSSAIPNDHLQYAVTWFLLAATWFGMTLYWMWRITRQT